MNAAPAGADCGFSAQATCKTEVSPKVMRTKFQALAEGAALASRELWKARKRKSAGHAAARRPAVRVKAKAKRKGAKR
jgi:hypothetical protein